MLALDGRYPAGNLYPMFLQFFTSLRDAQVPQDGLERIAHDAMGDFYLHQNARKVKAESELVDLLKQMW